MARSPRKEWMNWLWPEAGSNDLDNGFRRQDLDLALGSWFLDSVTVARPRVDTPMFISLRMLVAEEEQRLRPANLSDHHARGKTSHFGEVGGLSFRLDPVRLQFGVNVVRGHLGHAMSLLPELCELGEARVVALAAGAVARGESRCFVEEEEIGELPGRHELSWVVQR